MNELLNTINMLLMDPNSMTRLFALDLLMKNQHRFEPGLIVDLLRTSTQDPEEEVARKAKLSLSVLLQRGFPEEARIREMGIHSRMTDLSELERQREAEARRAALDVLAPAVEAVRDLAQSGGALAPSALEALGALQDLNSISLILSALDSASSRQSGLAALRNFRAPELVGVLERLLERTDLPEQKGLALTALGEMRSLDTRELLCRHVRSPFGEVRARAAWALGQLPRRGGADELMEMLEREDSPDVLVVVMEALGLVGKAPAAEAIGRRIREIPDPRIHSKAMIALGRIGDMAGAPHLIAGLRHNDARVQANAVEGLAALPLPAEEALRHFGPCLQSPSNRIRANAVMALYPHDPRRAVSELRILLNSKKPRERASAAYAVGEIQDPEALDALVILVNTEQDREVLGAALNSIGRLANPRLRPGLEKLLSHPSPQIRMQAISAYARIGGALVMRTLERAYQENPSEAVRATLVRAMGEVAQQGNLGFLQRKLQDPGDRVVASAIEALDRVGSLEVGVLVEPFLGHSSPRVRANACLALWHLGDFRPVEYLRTMLKSAEEASLRSALYALNQIGRSVCWSQLERRPLLLSALTERLQGLSSEEPSSEVQAVAELDESTEADRLLAQALLQVMEDREEEARQTADALLSAEPNSPYGLYLKARLERDEPGEKAIPSKALDETSFLYLIAEEVRMAKRSGDMHRVLSGYYRIFDMHLDILRQFVDLGRQELDEGHDGKASEIARTIVGQLQWTEDLHRRLGTLLSARHQTKRAFEQMLGSCLHSPDDAGAIIRLARQAARLQKTGMARTLAEGLRSRKDLTEGQRGQLAQLMAALGEE